MLLENGIIGNCARQEKNGGAGGAGEREGVAGEVDVDVGELEAGGEGREVRK